MWLRAIPKVSCVNVLLRMSFGALFSITLGFDQLLQVPLVLPSSYGITRYDSLQESTQVCVLKCLPYACRTNLAIKKGYLRYLPPRKGLSQLSEWLPLS